MIWPSKAQPPEHTGDCNIGESQLVANEKLLAIGLVYEGGESLQTAVRFSHLPVGPISVYPNTAWQSSRLPVPPWLALFIGVTQFLEERKNKSIAYTVTDDLYLLSEQLVVHVVRH